MRRVKDIGVTDQTYIVYTHLGEILGYNDTVLGYDLAALNINQMIEDDMKGSKKDIPDLVLVRKIFPKYRKKNKS